MIDTDSRRKTILETQGEVIGLHEHDGGQISMRIYCPDIVEKARPGQFVHLSVSGSLSMRRPISVMSVDKDNGTFDLLYKIVGEGTRQLSERKIGDIISVIGPIGNGFEVTENKIPLLIGGGVGMPPIIAMAQELKGDSSYSPYAILGSEVPFPFDVSKSELNAFYSSKLNTMPLLDEWGIPCGLASLQNYEGVYQGFVTDLAKDFLGSLSPDELSDVEIYTCGPHAMLEAVSKLANEYNIPCQASLEEFMACAVGGCAGCVVEVQTENGPAMKRVCVDGPVFEAQSVFNDFG